MKRFFKFIVPTLACTLLIMSGCSTTTLPNSSQSQSASVADSSATDSSAPEVSSVQDNLNQSRNKMERGNNNQNQQFGKIVSISQTVTFTSGRENNNSTITLADLTVGDVVEVNLNDAGEVSNVQLRTPSAGLESDKVANQ